MKCFTEEEQNTINIIQLAKDLKRVLDKFESAWVKPHLLEKTDNSGTIFETPDYPYAMELREFLSSLPKDVPSEFYRKETGTWKVTQP